MLNFIESGYVSSGDALPYLSLIKVSNVLDTRDTCANRIERSIYQISIYHDNFRDLNIEVDNVEDILDQTSLRVRNRRVLSTQFFEKQIFEPRPKIYQANLFYEVIAQRDFSSSNYLIGTGDISALLKEKITNVTSTSFGHPNWERPFIYIDNYNTVDAFLTTLSRLESTSFSVSIEDYNPLDVEDILEEIDDILSYSKLEVRNRRWTSLEWQGNSLIEIEPNIWKGSVNYEVILEKDLV